MEMKASRTSGFKLNYQEGKRLLLLPVFFFLVTFRKSIHSSTSNLHFIPRDISRVCVDFAPQSQRDTVVVKRLTAFFSCLADVDENLTSPERCLADSLLLLVEQQVGGQKMWLLPQTQWQEGETLRQTAERALSSLSGNATIFRS